MERFYYNKFTRSFSTVDDLKSKYDAMPKAEKASLVGIRLRNQIDLAKITRDYEANKKECLDELDRVQKLIDSYPVYVVAGIKDSQRGKYVATKAISGVRLPATAEEIAIGYGFADAKAFIGTRNNGIEVDKSAIDKYREYMKVLQDKLK